MSGIAIFTPMPLYISDNASEKVKALVEEEGNPDLKLRVFVTGGGCSGFQYDIKLDNPADDDMIIAEGEERVIVDPVSLPFLSGAVIDFSDELIGARFTIENPNATSSCGCGTSFSM